MSVKKSEKVFTDVCIQQFVLQWANHYNVAFVVFSIAVDKLVFCYIHSWQTVVHNMVSFRKIYFMIMIISVSDFQYRFQKAIFRTSFDLAIIREGYHFQFDYLYKLPYLTSRTMKKSEQNDARNNIYLLYIIYIIMFLSYIYYVLHILHNI